MKPSAAQSGSHNERSYDYLANTHKEFRGGQACSSLKREGASGSAPCLLVSAPWTHHRKAFVAAHGPIPKGFLVRHTCDNSRCVEPSHLVLGTHADNMRDRMERGRQARGERHGQSALSDAQLADVRARLANGERRVDIAALHGVSKALITLIAQGKRRGPPRPSTPEEAAYAAAAMRRSRAARKEAA